MAWTSPRTWVTGELVTAAIMNLHVRDNLSYLKASPAFDGAITVSGTVTATVATSINALQAVQSSTGAVQIGWSRAGGTASSWIAYLPSGSTDFRLFSGADRFTFTAAGAFTATAGIAGTTGAFSGDFAIATNKFTVASASGNTVVAGTLGVTGDVAVNTNKFTVAASSGNTLVAGTLSVTGDFAIATNKFTVTAASGNTVVAGTLGVSGAVVTISNVANTLTLTAGAGSTIATNANNALTLNSYGVTIESLNNSVVEIKNTQNSGGVKVTVSGSGSQWTWNTPVTTGAGSAALGSNSPATTNSAPFTWFRVIGPGGDTLYVPAWK